MRRPLAILILSLSLGTPVSTQASADAGTAPDRDVGVDSSAVVPQVDLSTPRASVRSFIYTMQRASADRPDLIDQAVRCLDVTWLDEEENRELRARQLAAQLFDVLGDLAVLVDDVPDSSRRHSLVIWQGSDPSAPQETLSISLARRHDEWRFSRATLEELDDLSEAIDRYLDGVEFDAGPVRGALRSPRATMETFLAAMNADPPDVDRAADCLEPPEEASSAWSVLRRTAAYRLYDVLLRARAPVLSDVPEHLAGQRFGWYVHEAGRIVLRRMEEDRPEVGVWRGEWRFSRDTVASLENLYRQHALLPLRPEVAELGYRERLSLGLRLERRMPKPLQVETVGLAIWKWLGILGLLICAVFVFAIVELVGRGGIRWLRRSRGLSAQSESSRRLSRAIAWFVTLAGLYWLIALNALLLPAGVLTLVYPFFRAMALIATALVGLRVVQLIRDNSERSEAAGRTRVTGLVLPLLESFFRLIVAAILVAFMLRLFGFSKAAVLGTLGLLGAAVGLAAQGSIANVVAAVSIVYDRPFRVGDWVNLDGVDATVERLGLVSVRLRTFYNSLVIVPNSHIVTKAVDNYGERRYRRLRHFLRLRYDTPAAKIDELCEGLRELVRLHPYTRKDYYHLYLNELTPSSANVLIYIFFEVPDWATELRERHRFLIDALALVEELGIELAYPTQRLLVETVEDAIGDEALPAQPKRAGVLEAKKLFTATYGDPPRERPPVVIETSPLGAGFDDDGGDGGDGV